LGVGTLALELVAAIFIPESALYFRELGHANSHWFFTFWIWYNTAMSPH
jgi:hypothetical protein